MWDEPESCAIRQGEIGIRQDGAVILRDKPFQNLETEMTILALEQCNVVLEYLDLVITR